MSMDTTGGAIVSRLLARGFRRNDFPWGFSNLDAFVHFHEPIGTEWLHIETRILTGSEGYVSGQTQTWSSAGNLLATAISQLAFFTATKGT